MWAIKKAQMREEKIINLNVSLNNKIAMHYCRPFHIFIVATIITTLYHKYNQRARLLPPARSIGAKQQNNNRSR